MKIVQTDRYTITVLIIQKLNIAQNPVWNHLNMAQYIYIEAEYLDGTPLKARNLMDQTFICGWLLVIQLGYLRQRPAKTFVVVSR